MININIVFIFTQISIQIQEYQFAVIGMGVLNHLVLSHLKWLLNDASGRHVVPFKQFGRAKTMSGNTEY